MKKEKSENKLNKIYNAVMQGQTDREHDKSKKKFKRNFILILILVAIIAGFVWVSTNQDRVSELKRDYQYLKIRLEEILYQLELVR